MKIKFIPVNMLLAIIVIFFTVQISEVWLGPDRETCKIEPAEKAGRRSERRIKRKKSSLNYYRAFVDRNLFSPDRSSSDAGGTGGEVKGYQANTECILYGILIAGNNKSALIMEKQSKRLRSRKTAKQKPEWVKSGEKFGSYTVDEILADRIFLTNHNIKTEILLNDPNNPKTRKKTPKKYRKLKGTKPASKRAPLLDRLPKLKKRDIRKKGG